MQNQLVHQVYSFNHNITNHLKTLKIDNTAQIIKHKVGSLNLAEEVGNLSKACKVMRLSRPSL